MVHFWPTCRQIESHSYTRAHGTEAAVKMSAATKLRHSRRPLEKYEVIQGHHEVIPGEETNRDSYVAKIKRFFTVNNLPQEVILESLILPSIKSASSLCFLSVGTWGAVGIPCIVPNQLHGRSKRGNYNIECIKSSSELLGGGPVCQSYQASLPNMPKLDSIHRYFRNCKENRYKHPA